ncbi:DUF5677 domain-containing protein [Streptomyces sp. NPDC047841]|uniref:DUF5677 domain-containing protein n=1 Tax=Streptomyces sp. NPDC047841 TaxID=3154708 RepID=UPI0034533404
MIESESAKFMKVIEREAEPHAREILELSREAHVRNSALHSQIESEISNRWARGWEFFDGVVYATQQNGAMLLRRADEADDDHSPMREALALIHSAACLVFQEIRTLLLAGFWSGAVGRWRALHELAVSAIIIARQDPSFAQRYLDHGFVVQTHRLYEYYEAHGRGPVPRQELEKRRAQAELLIQKHQVANAPKKFRDSYGWAAPLMPLNRQGDKLVPPTFDRLEKMANEDHLRLLVISAHGHVHSDSAGVVAAVVSTETDWALGPTTGFPQQVAKPAFLTMRSLIAATHLGFEPEFNEFAKVIGLCGASAMQLALWGLRAFDESANSHDSELKQS